MRKWTKLKFFRDVDWTYESKYFCDIFHDYLDKHTDGCLDAVCIA